jgi:hypothetical protein
VRGDGLIVGQPLEGGHVLGGEDGQAHGHRRSLARDDPPRRDLYFVCETRVEMF